MTEPVLKVDPAVLRSAGTAFGQAGEELAGLRAGEPLSEAAASVPNLATAAACRSAESLISSAMTSLAETARTYSDNLGTAARQYHANDQSSASKIGSVDFRS